MDILASLGALSTAQAQQMMELQNTQNSVQQLEPGASKASTPAVTVDLSPAAQAVLNQRAAAASPNNDDSGGMSFDDGGTGADDGGYEASQQTS